MCQTTFFHLSLFLLLCPAIYISSLGRKGEGGTRVGILIHALDFSIHRSLASHGSFIFCARLLTQLCLLSAEGELLWCKQQRHGMGKTSLLLVCSPQLPFLLAPKYLHVAVLWRNGFMYGFGVLVRYKITSWRSYSRSLCNKCIWAS